MSLKKYALNSVYLQYAWMIPVGEHVKMVELETLQVIVKSHGQNSYFKSEETMKFNPNFMLTHHIPLLFNAKNIKFSCI